MTVPQLEVTQAHRNILCHMVNGWVLILKGENYVVTDHRGVSYKVVREVVVSLRDHGYIRPIDMTDDEWLFGLTPKGEREAGEE